MAHQVVLLYQHSLLFAPFPSVLFAEKFKASGPDWALSKRDNLVKEMHLMKRSASEPMTPASSIFILSACCVCVFAHCASWVMRKCCMRVLLEKERHARHCMGYCGGNRRRMEKRRESIKHQSKQSSRTMPSPARPDFRFCPLAARIPVPGASISPQRTALFPLYTDDCEWEERNKEGMILLMVKTG